MTTVETMRQITLDGKRILNQMYGKLGSRRVGFFPDDMPLSRMRLPLPLPSKKRVLKSILRSYFKFRILKVFRNDK